MKTVSRWLLILLMPFYVMTAYAAGNYTEGREYTRLSSPQPVTTDGGIEVVELFWYGCPHCYHLEPYVENWLKDKPDDVEFVRMPAILGRNWELLAKAYYTAELLGVLDRIHPELFDAIHERKEKITDESALRAFFVKHGVSAEDFDRTFKSFAVNVKTNNARLMTRRYAITGVPTLIVNGKYSTGPSMVAGANDSVMEVVDYLVAQERATAAAHGAR
jgi:thiol:disulfide interchange protein DsbA